MRTTTNWGLTVPSASTDPDDVPTQVGAFGDQLDADLGAQGGTFAARPNPGILNQLYFVTTGTNAGTLYRWNGTSWDTASGVAGVTGDVTTAGFGDVPAIGTPSKGYAPSDHRHGQQANPVIAHVAASNPHPQYYILQLSKTAAVPTGTPAGTIIFRLNT